MFFPITFLIPVTSGLILSLIPLGLGEDLASGFYGSLIASFYFCFVIGQLILFILMRTRSDVRATKTFSDFDAWLLTLLYVLMLLIPFFVPGNNQETGTPILSLAARYVGILFLNCSDDIGLLLLLAVCLLNLVIFVVVIYERLTQTSIDMGVFTGR